jgi:hypothetical protein
MKNTSALLGNGINQLGHIGASWNDVLSELADYAGRPQIMDEVEHKPFTLVYEEVIAALTGPDPDEIESDVKRKVAETVQRIPRNPYHEEFEKINFQHILTTNYDYNFSPKAISSNLRPESKYSVFRRRLSQRQSIWMIHGEVEKPDTIMLGHEQYAGSLQKIRTYVTKKDKSPGKYSSPFRAGDYSFDVNKKVHSWVDVFLRDDIHILGFSLDYTEIELWWLIAYKARLKRKSSLEIGETYFYFFSKNRKEPKNKAKVALLESLGVKVYLKEVKKNDFRLPYDWALKRLSKMK